MAQPLKKAYVVMKVAGGYDWSSYDLVCICLDEEVANKKAEELQGKTDLIREVLQEALKEQETKLTDVREQMRRVMRESIRIRKDKNRDKKEDRCRAEMQELHAQQQQICKQISDKYIQQFGLEGFIDEYAKEAGRSKDDVTIFNCSPGEWDYVVEEAPLE
jgi:hypothetical protein